MNAQPGRLDPESAAARPTSMLILAAAQALALYLLHRAIEAGVWPATQLAVLVSLYLLVVFLPLTTQLLSKHLREPRLWLALLALGVALVLFGWHFAANVVAGEGPRALVNSWAPASAFVLFVLWLIAIAFLRAQLESGRSLPSYHALFAAAWRNKLTLLEAAIFTGVFWLLLWLWAALFSTLDIDFFRELFRSAWFMYAASAMVIGLALYWIGSVDRMVDVVLTQVLSLFKWLAPLAGLIVVLFTFALLPSLGDLFGAGRLALRALWLLWLVAGTVLLLNAAYQDGSVPPYGRWLAAGMRCVPPLLLVVALVAAYAVYVRIDALGLTVSRFWGLVTALFAVAHSAAATAAAIRPGPWLGLLGKTNPLLAAALAVTLGLSLTPVLSPYRLATQSQIAVAQTAVDVQRRAGALSYLQFSAGRYGQAAIARLAEGDGVDGTLAEAARNAQARTYPAVEVEMADFDTWWQTVAIYPPERAAPPELLEALRVGGPRPGRLRGVSPYAVWVDVVGGPALELVLFEFGTQFEVYAEEGGAWRRVARGFAEDPFMANDAQREVALERGDFASATPELRDVVIGDRRILLRPLR